MKKILLILVVLGFIIIGFSLFNSYIYHEKQADAPIPSSAQQQLPEIIPVSHASLIVRWNSRNIYIDPTGDMATYSAQFPADIVLVTDIHGDHLDVQTLETILGGATLVTPQAVKDMLPVEWADRARVLANDETTTEMDFDITGIPMYNLPESVDSRHVKGRGNGYVIENGGTRIYIAGDTSGIPEMRALMNIDIAFIPMNAPLTMDVEEAADAVLAFKPRQVYPYHYRAQGGFADVAKFKELVHAGDSTIEVILLNWYSEQ